jgi:hypothetical protein
MVGSNNAGVVEFGTHRTVTMKDGVRHVVNHNPPRGYHEVLDDILRRMTETQGGGEVKQVPATVGASKPAGSKPRVGLAELMRDHTQALEDLLVIAGNVLQEPLLRLSGSSTDRVGGIRLRQSTEATDGGRPSLGQYRDFRDKPRSLPQLNAVTLQGILIATGALDTEEKPTEDVLRRIASSASRYRRDHGFGGGDCGPEAVELYIRIFRVLGVTNEMAGMARADDLQRVYL